MAVYVQILLALCCVLLAQGYVMHRKLHYFSPSQPPVHDGVDVHTLYSPLNPDLSLEPLDDRPIDGNIFSYNNQRSFDDYYGDGNYNPGLYSYFPYPSYDNRPFGYPPINNGFYRPIQNHGYPNAPNAPDGYNNPNGNPSNNNHPADKKNKRNKKPEDKQQPSNRNESKPSVPRNKTEDVPPKANKISSDDGSSNNNSVGLKQNKEYLLVGNNGNMFYLLHEANTPNTNVIVMPNNNQPVGNNVVYVPYNPQQPGNQVYQIVSRQQPTSTNNPMTANRVNLNGYNNVVANPVPNNVPATNPSYVLIYANGQLIQIPGVVLNPPKNVVLPNTVASPSVVYQPAHGNNPMYIQLPNGSPVSNGVTNPHENPQLVANPNNIPNNNVGTYAVVNQPNIQQPPIANNMGNGFAQPNVISNPGNQGSVANSVNPNPATSVNNQPTQPAYAMPINNNSNNQATNPPHQEKEVNAGGPAGNNIPPTNGQSINRQPVGQPTEPSNNAGTNTLDVLPAVMVSGFKENQGNDKKKEQENAEE